MHFCPNCKNVFDIAKTAKNPNQKGGGDSNSVNTIIQKTLAKQKLGGDEMEVIERVGLTSVIKMIEKDGVANHDLTKKDIEHIINKLTDDYQKLKKSPGLIKHNVSFVCTNCGLTKPIPNDTMIFTKASNDVLQNYSGLDFANMMYSDILPRTRKYLCPNKKCPSHTDYEKREASFFRMNNLFKIKYGCHACGTIFDNQ